MANRNTLHISKLEAFKNWLIKDGWEILPLSKNPYEVLRASKMGISNPLIVYSGKSKEHLSFANEWLPVVEAFLHKKTNADRIRSMTENEAIEELKYDCNELGKAIPCDTSWGESFENAYAMAISALEEVQQYRKIGTVEECREAVEKQTAKKPTLIDYKKYANFVDNVDFLQDAYWCPNCKRVVRSGSFCRDCGQKLGWSDEE